MAKISVRDRNKNNADRKPNWEYRFEAAKSNGKRHHISKSGFRTKREAEVAGIKALAEYNNAGLHFEPSEIGFNDYIIVRTSYQCVHHDIKKRTLTFRQGSFFCFYSALFLILMFFILNLLYF